MKRILNWLKREWAICNQQAACPHLNADKHWRTPCPDCGYVALFEIAC